MRKRLCIFVNGYPRSGKDTFAEVVMEEVKGLGLSAINYSTIDTPKHLHRVLFGEIVKDNVYRRQLSEIKCVLLERLPYDVVELQRIDADVVIVHVREPWCLTNLLNQFGGISVFIERSEALSCYLLGGDLNDSDMHVGAYKYLYTISNNGTLDEFRKDVRSWFKDHVESMLL